MYGISVHFIAMFAFAQRSEVSNIVSFSGCLYVFDDININTVDGGRVLVFG